MLKRIVRALLPAGIRYALNNKLNQMIRYLKAPRMVLGYRDSSGEWRPRTRVSDTVFLYYPEKISLADNVFVWHFSILDGTGGLEIGEGTQVGAWVGIFTHSSHISIRLYGKRYMDIPEDKKKGFKISPVKIGKYVFIGAGAIILPGLSVGDGAIVSAGAMVAKNVEPFEIVAGSPAVVIGDTRSMDRSYLLDPQILESYNEWQKTE